MRHVKLYKMKHGCFMRGNCKENEAEHKTFKTLIQNTNRHIDSISSQLLTVWTETNSTHPIFQDSENSSDNENVSTSGISQDHCIKEKWTNLVNNTITISKCYVGRIGPNEHVETILSLQSDGINVWQRQKEWFDSEVMSKTSVIFFIKHCILETIYMEGVCAVTLWSFIPLPQKKLDS